MKREWFKLFLLLKFVHYKFGILWLVWKSREMETD